MSLDIFLTNVAATNLANGAPANITPIFMTAGLADHYKSWKPSDITAPVNTDLVKVLASDISRGLLAAIPDANKRVDTSLALAMARVTSYTHWGIDDAKLITAQVADFKAGLDAAAVTDVTTNAANTDWSRRGTPAEIQVQYLLVNARMTTTDGYPHFLTKVGRAAAGCFVTTGVTLAKTMIHHFVDPHKPVSRAVLKEVFGRKYRNSSFFTLTADELEDIVCHKANHAVQSATMLTVARDAKTIDRMTAYGLASSVVRVPALTDIESAYSAVCRLASVSGPILSTANVAVGADSKIMYDEAKELTEAAGRVASVQDRNALERAFRSRIEAHSGSVAWILGFYLATLEENPNPKESLSKAKYLTRMRGECHTQVVAGSTHYKDYRKWVRNQLDKDLPPAARVFGA